MKYAELVASVAATKKPAQVNVSKLVSFTAPTQDACMLQGLAAFMGVSASALGEQLLAPVLAKLFDTVPEENKMDVAILADSFIRKHVKHNPKSLVEIDHWQKFLENGKTE